MVGEGVLRECLADPKVGRVLSVTRRPSGHRHPKLSEVLVPDFLQIGPAEAKLIGYDVCLYCAGVSSAGMKEPEYTRITYDTTLHFAETLARINPGMTFEYISGAQTDSTEHGKVMWARVKGRTENALTRLPFAHVYNIRPGGMKPSAGQRNVPWYYRALGSLYPVFRAVLSNHVSTLSQVGRAMLYVAANGYPKTTLEVRDLNALARP